MDKHILSEGSNDGGAGGKFVTDDITPDEQRGIHKVLIGLATFFFIWLVVEGILLVPVLFSRYGLH